MNDYTLKEDAAGVVHILKNGEHTGYCGGGRHMRALQYLVDRINDLENKLAELGEHDG